MKQNLFLAALVGCLSLCGTSQAVAANWRVNYDSQAKADFRDINSAMADSRVTDGDTLFLDLGTRLTSSQTISKAVTVIGPGYFIGENDADEAYLSADLYITADDVKVTGLHTSSIYIRANNAVVERCRVIGNIYGTGNYENDNASIRSCFLTNTQIQGHKGDGALGWEILNNIFYQFQYGGMSISDIQEAVISHNLFYKPDCQEVMYDTYNSTFTNNILLIGSYQFNCGYLSSGNIFSHNILRNSLGDYPNNTTISFDSRFNVIEGTESEGRDVFYRLAEESPAKGYAENGADCGPWDGPYPYVLSGYPLHIPRFESINVPSKPEDGKLKVTLKIFNQNE